MTTSKAELIQYGDRKFSEKWVKATDAEEQRRVLSELVTFKKLDEIKLLIELGVNPNVHNRNNKFRGNVRFIKSTRNDSTDTSKSNWARVNLDFGNFLGNFPRHQVVAACSNFDQCA